MLRDWTNSDKINSISQGAEILFVRLIMKVDDYGCFYADERLVKANLFPLKIDAVREADISRWMAECQKAGLIALYECNGKKYLQIQDFRQRLDRARAKYPLPDSNDSLAIVNDFPPEVEEKPKGSRREGTPGDFSGAVTYNAEDTILQNQIEFERIIMTANSDIETAKRALHTYHLYLEENEKYPKGKKAVFAGFEKWLGNEKSFTRPPTAGGEKQMVL